MTPVPAGPPSHTKVSRRPAHFTVTVCSGAAFLTLLLTVTSVPALRAGDVPFLLFALSPYLALGVLATGLRRSPGWAWALLGLSVVLSLAGLGCFAVDSWTFHTVPEYRMVQRFSVLVVPSGQLLVIAPFAAALLFRGRR